ncbi:MAG: 3'-5' exonuclease [Bacteriovoracaceae bacterium]|jgi:DNA polymerase III subunit epsilon|nr:3'-5' exonuclease [Bacteriovoracaceae bacterium]
MSNPTETSLSLIKNLTFCVFDLETTGGNHKNDKIIEIGLVRVINLEIVEKKTYLIQPEIKIPDFIQKLTAITPDDVKDSPIIEEVIEDIIEFMGDSILVAHNTSFDIPFFNSVLRRLKKPELTNKSLCTNLMTKYLIPNLMNSNLNYMSKIFNIQHNKAHRALDDAIATTHLLLNYLNIFISKDIQKINHLYYPRNRYELDRANFKKGTSLEIILDKMDSIKTPSLVSIKGINGIILYSLPFNNTKADRELISIKIKEMPWETVTIKLIGPLIEILIYFNNLFAKLDLPTRQEIINHLWDQHLPNHQNKEIEPSNEDTGGLSTSQLISELGDFIITHHLVPEQLFIYPIQSLHPKSELVFRFPGHKKKLMQYISSKSSRINANKLKKTHFSPMLRAFLESYLLEAKENKSDVFFFKKKLPLKSPDDFFDELDKFLLQNPNPYNYPKHYI